MLAYQAGIAKFEGDGTKIFAISTDNTPSQKAFAEQVKASFPMLSDFTDSIVDLPASTRRDDDLLTEAARGALRRAVGKRLKKRPQVDVHLLRV